MSRMNERTRRRSPSAATPPRWSPRKDGPFRALVSESRSPARRSLKTRVASAGRHLGRRHRSECPNTWTLARWASNVVFSNEPKKRASRDVREIRMVRACVITESNRIESNRVVVRARRRRSSSMSRDGALFDKLVRHVQLFVCLLYTSPSPRDRG